MRDGDRVEVILQGIDMINNLNEVVDQAGGSGFNVLDLKEMTALELIAHLCTNNVRFTFIKPKKGK